MDQKRDAGRTYLRIGVGLALLAPLIFATRFALLRQLETPWYFPGIAAVGAMAIGIAMARRRSWRRALLFFVVLVECFGSAAILASAELEPYAGTATVGGSMPAFEATLATNGLPFTEADLMQGTQVLVFYRGHL